MNQVAGAPDGWRVVDARFETSAASVEQCPEPTLPEVAIAGRSNVGKSSVLNILCGRKGLARVSRTPGRTQLLNTFIVDLAGPPDGAGEFVRRSLRLIDLPGYGFAAATRKVREGFAPMIEGYLTQRPVLCGLILLIDIRRGLTDLDHAMADFVMERALPTVLVATKADKIGAAARGKARQAIAEAVGIRRADVRLSSAHTGLGIRGPGGLADDVAALLERADQAGEGTAGGGAA